MKQVKNSTSTQNFYLTIIKLLKQNLNPTQISKKLNISKQKLNYYIRQLKKNRIIRKIGYGTWEVVKEVKKSTQVALIKTSKKEVRGHAFMWKVKLPKIKNWEKRTEILKKLKINFKLINNRTPRIILQNRKIWLGSKNLIIYEPQSFIAENSIESRKLAVYGLKSLLEALESKLKVSFKINKLYQFKVAREHYALMKNLLAIQCNKQGDKIYVYDAGGLWFCIDNSYNLDEAETLHKNAMINNLGVQKYFNSHKATNFKVTPEFILDSLNKQIQNQSMFSRNIEKHFEVLTKIGNAIDKLGVEIRGINKQNKILKQKIKSKQQTKLHKFL